MKCLTIAALSTLFVLNGCTGSMETDNQASQASTSNEQALQANISTNQPIQKVTLSKAEENFIRYLLNDDIEIYFEGGQSILSEHLPKYVPDEISKDFEQNEVRALSKYKDKTFVVVGKVADIQAGLNDMPIVILRTKINLI